jgi:uncharacterized coiled-coil protein SlyX
MSQPEHQEPKKQVELPPLELTQEERTKAEGMAKAVMESGAPLDCIESYVLHVYARERQLFSALTESAAKDGELETLRARVEEVETKVAHREQWLQEHSDRLDASDDRAESAGSRLRAVSEALENEAKRCEYCGTDDCDHKHTNGNGCCVNCCASHGMLTGPEYEHGEYEFVQRVVDHKNALRAKLHAIVEGKPV